MRQVRHVGRRRYEGALGALDECAAVLSRLSVDESVLAMELSAHAPEARFAPAYELPRRLDLLIPVEAAPDRPGASGYALRRHQGEIKPYGRDSRGAVGDPEPDRYSFPRLIAGVVRPHAGE